MIINGFQKLTLLDFPSKVACIVFTPGCNFKCPFCHNAALVTHINPEDRMDINDILSYLNNRKGLLEGVSITGGEPLMQKGIKDFIKQVKDMGYSVKVDTNGTYPELLIELINENLVDYVAMDIKNNKQNYAKTAGVDSVDLINIQKSISFLLEGKVEYEFRTTVVDGYHTVDTIADIADWIKGAKKYYLQNFKDSGDTIQKNLKSIPQNTLLEMQKAAQNRLVPTFIR